MQSRADCFCVKPTGFPGGELPVFLHSTRVLRFDGANSWKLPAALLGCSAKLVKTQVLDPKCLQVFGFNALSTGVSDAPVSEESGRTRVTYIPGNTTIQLQRVTCGSEDAFERFGGPCHCWKWLKTPLDWWYVVFHPGCWPENRNLDTEQESLSVAIRNLGYLWRTECLHFLLGDLLGRLATVMTSLWIWCGVCIGDPTAVSGGETLGLFQRHQEGRVIWSQIQYCDENLKILLRLLEGGTCCSSWGKKTMAVENLEPNRI